MPQRVKFVNLGCPKNLVDSERMAGLLKGAGWNPVEEQSVCEALVINTCSFIEDARRESVEAILEGSRWKAERSGRRLYVAGCLPQRYPQELRAELPEVDGFFNVGEYQGLVEAVSKSPLASSGVRRRFPFTPRHYRYLRIADGCDRKCAYCAIPAIRGPYSSRPLDELVEEAEALVSEGARELVIVAQEINSYGKDLPGGGNLIGLLEKLTGIESLDWIRLMYLHPPLVEETLIEFAAAESKMCPYFDFPIEHIDDGILRRMGRGITRAGIEGKLLKMKELIPDCAVRTSIMVGFPGEGEAEFAELADFVAEGWFDRLGAFVYSPEAGTRAYSLQGAVPPEEAAFRQETIMEIQREVSLKRNRSMVDQKLKVLVDEALDGGQWFGRTVYDAPEVDGGVIFRGEAAVSEFTEVMVTEAGEYDLQGVSK